MIVPFRALLAALLLLVPTFAAEVGARVLIDAERLPLAPSSNAFADVTLANLVRTGAPDVLVLGTSAARSAIRPDTLERLLSEAVGRPIQVHNAALGGIDLADQRLLVSGLAAIGLLPDTVILPITVMTATGRHPEGGWFARSELGQLWSGCATVAPLTRSLECWLGQGSALWRWRGYPDRIVEAVTGDSPASLRDGKRRIHEDGWVATAPTSERELRAAIPRHADELGTDVAVPAQTAAEFEALISELHARDVTVVALEMPYAPGLQAELTARETEWPRHRREAYQRLEAAAGIDIVEVASLGDWAGPATLRDPRHLSRFGAGPFTRQLWALDDFRQPLLERLSLAG